MAAIPAKFKPLQHYLKTAVEHQQRDPVITYYCKLFALQLGMKIDKKSSDCVQFLSSVMDELEMIKKSLGDNEAISSEIVGQAHVENYALKVFLFADTEDRAGKFSKNVVKSFYTAGMLYDVLTNFGELSEEDDHRRRYAKWKAAYIHNCLKSGETPVAGPFGDEFGTSGSENIAPNPSTVEPSSGVSQSQYPPAGTSGEGGQYPQHPIDQPPPTSAATASGISLPPSQPTSTSVTADVDDLHLEDYKQAQKWCKFASSALEYQDGPTAIGYLEKAIDLLRRTGQR